MNRIALIFSRSPHGSSIGREGLDALLAISAFTETIDVFFISDGVFLLLPNQKPEQILAKNFISTFGILSLWNINKLYVCADSINDRGISFSTDWVLKVKCVSAIDWRGYLSSHDVILTF